ncbi:hypothetical protein B0H13DRAFT_2688436 [Mycena leptocephala]|nr:hypothetical protein B0H13DRAFT_2688436 [Mycena leptocephala]
MTSSIDQPAVRTDETTMGMLAVPPGDPFKDHLLAVLSLHDAPRAAAAPVPRYSGPPRLADHFLLGGGAGASTTGGDGSRANAAGEGGCTVIGDTAFSLGAGGMSDSTRSSSDASAGWGSQVTRIVTLAVIRKRFGMCIPVYVVWTFSRPGTNARMSCANAALIGGVGCSRACLSSLACLPPPVSLALPPVFVPLRCVAYRSSNLRMPIFRSPRIASDALAATRLTLKAIQASTDVFPPLKSAVSVAIVLSEMSENVKRNKKECEHIAKRSAKLVQDIWTQTRDFSVALPVEVEKSVVEIERLFKEIKKFFKVLRKENIWERFARQDHHKGQIEEYDRLLQEAMLDFSFNLNLSIHRLQLESAAVDEKRHTAVLAVSQMTEAERVQLLTQIRGDVRIGKHAAVWLASGVFFFRSLLCYHYV